MKAILAIFRKEMIDAMRDRRTLLVVLLSSLLGVPLLLLIVSEVLSQVESQEVKRTVIAVNMKSAPSLENYILRQGFQIRPAPADYEKKLHSKELIQPVLLVPQDFEDKLSHGEKATLEVVFDTANTQAQFGMRPLRKVLDGFAQEHAALGLTMRGVSPEVLQMVEVRERQISRPEERKVTITGMLPFMLIMAIVIGGMYAAIDTTAGERERGSLEPLMMNPVSGWQLAIGKWAAVATVSMTVVVLTVLSFFPSQWLIRNETLRAEFQFGAGEALGFLVVLLPLAASLAAIQIAVALNCKSYKEAQVRNQILSLVVSMVPLTLTFNPGREPAWFQWAPVLAQNIMMNHVLKGEAAGHVAIAIALLVCAALTGLSLSYVAQKMRRVVMV
ncbi:ABC transporter permease [Undibacterium sp.]|jgi:sodium transport system permease protein|uniref:ABC transporter permease n=1 Tax=Undibacterium sp. TaxID=1914977 RepID=UPI002C07C52C|nr:ABC transporter permease subunit [Undibacterium sp.]HTD02853.1 ABC transporter permease subunit [Undibacterium sp.]